VIKRERSLDRLAYALATGAGAGFAPVAPGTFGALEGVALFLAISALATRPLALGTGARILLLTAINVAIFALGVWASNRACEITGLKDPSQVVFDEVSGQLIALTAVIAAPTILGVVAAFILFRLFDIFKPYPIRKLEHLPSGLGVMADDALAGVYAAALVWAMQIAIRN